MLVLRSAARRAACRMDTYLRRTLIMIPRLLSGMFVALSGLALLSSVGFAQEQNVDLELVLAVDVSRSMDLTEQKLQKDGYIAALQHPEVLAAIAAGMLGRIAV